MQQVVFNKKLDSYYFIVTLDDPAKCNLCERIVELTDIVFFHRKWTRKAFVKNYFCEHCAGKKKKQEAVRIVTEDFFFAEVTTEIPFGSNIVFDTFPGFKDSRTNVYGAAVSNKGICADTSDVVVIDRTVHAGRVSGRLEDNPILQDEYNKAQLLIQSEEERLNKPPEDIDSIFSAEMKAVPIISNTSRSLIKANKEVEE